MASTIQLRVDDDLKAKSDELFKDLGTDTTTAIRIFLTQAVATNGFPFGALTEDELLEKLENSREHAEQGMFRDASTVSGEMRTKYGL